MKAWVYPAWGDDATGALNDPSQPFKSIQAAIDALFAHLKTSNPPDPKTLQGLVWCMPGLYGPTSYHGTAASGDTFPILMRHRVHVRGVGARRCVIRGAPQFAPYVVFWPVSLPSCNPNQNVPIGKQVLVSYALTSQYEPDPANPGIPAPWTGGGEVAEILDGFTLQGGDVQVVFRTSSGPSTSTFPTAGRISNCVFDMRHGYSIGSQTVDGPYMGILMEKRFDDHNVGVCGYFDQKVHIAHNTFVFAYFDGVWKNDARLGAVGIIDVTNPNSQVLNPFDINLEQRGLGNPGLQNNVFRTRPANDPANTGRMAMLGIDAVDTMVRDGAAGGAYVTTNAFAPGRAGSASTLFRSTPAVSALQGYFNLNPVSSAPPWLEPVYYEAGATTDCDPTGMFWFCSVTPAPIPTPAVPLWNGGPGPFNPQQVDPAFVGEYLVTLPPPNPVLPDYADWRLVPGSPMVDQGRLWAANQFQNGSQWQDVLDVPGSPCEELRLDRWDGEGYGNVRRHGANVDIGFDEFHLAVIAGSYANGDNSHNRMTVLNPSVPTSQSERRVLLPISAGGAPLLNSTVRIKGAERPAPIPIPPATYPGWTQPPKTLATPLIDTSLPLGYRTAYINMSVERWTASIQAAVTWNTIAVPGWGNPFQLHRVALPPDDEGPNFDSWFNTQAVIDFTGPALPDLWGNLQAEYR